MTATAVTRVASVTSQGSATWEVTIERYPYARVQPPVGDIPEDVREALKEWLANG